MTTGRPQARPEPARAGSLVTPDGRYLVVRGRLWRRTDPALDDTTRQALVNELMAARRAVRDAGRGSGDLKEARARVDAAKRALGERGPPWWTDGAPDYTRRLARNTPYAGWFSKVSTLGVLDAGSTSEEEASEPGEPEAG